MLPETTYLPTHDGWRLAIHHLAHCGPPRRHPVLMLHGFGSNRFTVDLDERYSIARAAALRGFDVYMIELRGSGLSLLPGQDRAGLEWGFGEYATIDLPAAVRHVLSQSGARALHGLGHSMGGMLLYAYGTEEGCALRSIVAIGSPLICELDLAATEKLLLGFAAKIVPQAAQRFPIRSLVGMASRFVALSPLLGDGLLLNVANCDADVIARMARDAIHDVPLRLVMEMTEHATKGHFDTDPFAYEHRLDRITAPVMILAGSVDRVAPPASVAAATLRLLSADVRYREMGRRFGDRTEYGHVDLMVGQAAPAEVYPAVLDFLEEVD